MQFKDLTGKKFGRLTAQKCTSRSPSTTWLCRCECGKKKRVAYSNLVRGLTKSCGCIGRERPSHLKHGLTETRFYGIWRHIKTRCLNKKSDKYSYYGGRGITICDEWLEFENFQRDMYKSYLEHYEIHGKDTSIERVDNSKGYFKENCRWATQSEQSRNRRKRL